MRSLRLLKDFHDFLDCVKKQDQSVFMEPSELFNFERELGPSKDCITPTLAKLSVIQFQNGSQKLFFEREFGVSLKVMEFLKRLNHATGSHILQKPFLGV